jgi:hypothetical protein
MNLGKIVFSQLTSLFPKYEFDKCIKKYNGNYKTQEFTCWEHFLVMIFAQLTTRESLRDIENSLKAIPDRLYHMGIRSEIAKSTLADANKNRDYHIFSEFALALSERARKLYLNDPGFTLDLDNLVYAIDSTTIDLCLSLYPWAKFRKKKAGLKMHTLLDVRGSIPLVLQLSPAVFHDVHFMDIIRLQPGAIYLMDRAYLSFNRLYNIKAAGAYFIIKAKSNLQYKVVERKSANEDNIIADQIIQLKTRKSQKDYPDQLRRIKLYDAEESRYVTILTNNFLLSAKLIGDLYRHRWRIELFFKWIKQHLKIKSFLEPALMQ